MPQLLVAGLLVMLIVGALEEAAVVGGLTALGARLCSIGIPKRRDDLQPFTLRGRFDRAGS
jgi:hypothetical protein